MAYGDRTFARRSVVIDCPAADRCRMRVRVCACKTHFNAYRRTHTCAHTFTRARWKTAEHTCENVRGLGRLCACVCVLFAGVRRGNHDPVSLYRAATSPPPPNSFRHHPSAPTASSVSDEHLNGPVFILFFPSLYDYFIIISEKARWPTLFLLLPDQLP